MIFMFFLLQLDSTYNSRGNLYIYLNRMSNHIFYHFTLYSRFSTHVLCLFFFHLWI